MDFEPAWRQQTAARSWRVAVRRGASVFPPEGAARAVQRLKRRRDFLLAAKGRKASRRAFLLETRARGDDQPVRFGFTVTKRTARKAVERNRIRRRLKEAVRLTPLGSHADGFDHVIVGRRAALALDFPAIAADLADALLHNSGLGRRGGGPQARD